MDFNSLTFKRRSVRSLRLELESLKNDWGWNKHPKQPGHVRLQVHKTLPEIPDLIDGTGPDIEDNFLFHINCVIFFMSADFMYSELHGFQDYVGAGVVLPNYDAEHNSKLSALIVLTSV